MLKFLDRKKLQILFFSDFNPDSMIFLLNLFAKFKEFSSEHKAKDNPLSCAAAKWLQKYTRLKEFNNKMYFKK